MAQDVEAAIEAALGPSTAASGLVVVIDRDFDGYLAELVARARQSGADAPVVGEASGRHRRRPDRRGQSSATSTSRPCRSGFSRRRTGIWRSNGPPGPAGANRGACQNMCDRSFSLFLPGNREKQGLCGCNGRKNALFSRWFHGNAHLARPKITGSILACNRREQGAHGRRAEIRFGGRGRSICFNRST